MSDDSGFIVLIVMSDDDSEYSELPGLISGKLSSDLFLLCCVGGCPPEYTFESCLFFHDI